MLRFLHGYREESWEGFVRRGLIDNTSGVKFHQIYDTPAGRRFNQLAAKGGRLYEIVRECARPFYIDRLQGGWWFDRYPYDRQLLQIYADLCGSWMLGLQMHEWASNMHNDWRRIENGLAAAAAYAKDNAETAVRADSGTPDAERIARATMDNCHIPGEKRSWLESASAEEYAGLKMPRSAEEAYRQYSWLFNGRQRENLNLLLPADSVYMAVRQEMDGGARALMPEIGAQIPLERWQIALTRGMARASAILWGAYYEPWGGKPFGCCYYKHDFINEWDVSGPQSGLFAGFYPNGGSSRALQKRIYYHSLLSGARFLSEEWGNANTFYDWRDFELTPYGSVKKDFLDFASRHRDLGDVVTPAALVLPRAFAIFDLVFLSRQSEAYLDFPIESPVRRKQFTHLREVLQLLLGGPERRFGNEGHVIGNSAYGDVFDIVYDDIGERVLSQYDLLVDLNVKAGLAGRYPRLAGRIIGSSDIRAMEIKLQAGLDRLLPCQVRGDLSWILNRTAGGWVLGLFNNEGVDRSQEHGDVFLAEADTTAEIIAPDCRLDVLCGDKGGLRHDGQRWRCAIPAGQVVLLNIGKKEGY